MRIEETETDFEGEPTEALSSRLRISSLDDDDNEIEEETSNNPNDIYEDDDDDDGEEEVSVTLGFVEKPENKHSLLRQVALSKAGGVPAWLDPVNLPSGKECFCDMCGQPLQFLIQVYAPTDKESTFHRTLYVFMCLSMTCLLRDQHEQWRIGQTKPSRSVKVFRCQLPRSNTFMFESRRNGADRAPGIGVPLCDWCGTWKGCKTCSRCRRVRYCSEKHQKTHWPGHKDECQKLSASLQSSAGSRTNLGALSSEMSKVASKTLWPEYKITEECESMFSISDGDEQSDALVPAQRVDETVNSMMDSFEGDDDKKSWATFQERLARAPEQVLRYSRDERAEPLWPTSSGRPSRSNIPKCSYCGGPMKFEFQILPQLLYYFGVKNEVDSLDWATVVVYTCVESCDSSAPYKEEFAWVQLTSQSANGA